ncbi:Na/Pi cotransporter family protein [Anaerobaca lacustris]|uniref:Na/Pi cotransporter family protein n=1 Tax=Anaerobaca lacustris TaxID=3044600 RepID=A0AAW6TWP5_9BACT|nr:Na/Pi cotransporter family protein [Sedimentisphaerales bacterium M17dextr]
MDIKDMVFGTVGGLGLFLFGMGLMTDGLRQVAGQKLKSLLEALTKHRVVAVLMGASVTFLIQSSSATTVMTVGLVNAGLLTLRQALCVVLGANVGTTFTAWLVSAFAVFKISSYALPMVGLGFLFSVAGKSMKARSVGQIMIGFGLLFLGIHFMKETFAPLGDSEGTRRALIWLGTNPILAILAGTILTMLLQSSSASIALIQTLALQGAFGTDWDVVLRVAIPFVLGDNIGTTITAQIAALRTSRNARRTAMGHTMFNVIGVLYVLPLVWLGWFADLVEWIAPVELSQGTVMVFLAIAHSTFNVFNTIVFLPLIRLLEIVVLKILPLRADETLSQPVILERHLLHTPVLALEQARREIVRMAKTAETAVLLAIESILEDLPKNFVSVREIEDQVDAFQMEITSYLTDLSEEALSEDVSAELPVLLHAVNDLERIGDHAVNIVEIAERKNSQKLGFSDAARQEAEQIRDELIQMFSRVVAALEARDVAKARSALANERKLNEMQLEFRRSHVARMTDGVCTAVTGLIFIDLVDNAEKIGDHLTNIAQATIGGLQWEGVKPQKVAPAS